MIYELITVDVLPLKLKGGYDVWLRDSLPVWKKYGIKHVGSWETMIGKSNEVVRLFGYEDLAHFERWRKVLNEDEDVAKTHRAAWPNLAHVERKILIPIEGAEIF